MVTKMNELYERDGFTIAVPENDINLTNILVTHKFAFVKKAHYGCDDNSISVCNNEHELYNALGEFHGDY